MYLVTGGSSGIGKALALALAARGKSVLITGRREPLLIDVAASSPLIEYVCADLSTVAGREIMLAKISRMHASLEGLINNAGMLEPLVTLENMELPVWQQIMATNVEAPLFLTQKCLPILQGGKVLNMGSGAAHMPFVGMGAYCISKAALHMLTRCYAKEFRDIAFANVMPGIIDTEMQRLLRESTAIASENQHFYQTLKKNNQLISPETVAAFLCWLLLDVSFDEYQSKEWDIYDESHHALWLKPPHTVPAWSE